MVDDVAPVLNIAPDPEFDAGFAPAPAAPAAPTAPIAVEATPAPSTPVNVFSPEGDLVSIDSANMPKALEQGFREAAPEEVDDHFLQQEYGTAGQQVKTFAERAVSAATFGASTALEKAFGVKDEDINKRAKANPGIGALGEVAGLVAPSLIPGVGELAAAKAMESGGAAAAKLLGLGGETASLASKLGARTVSEAAQMAMFQGGNEISKMISNDPEQSAQTALGDIGMASLLGAGAGVVFGSVAPLWKASVGDKAGQIAADFKGRMKFHLDNPDPAAAMADELAKHQDAMVGIRSELYGAGGLKQEALGKLLPELNPEIQSSTRSITDKVRSTVADMRADPESFSASQVKSLEHTLSGIEDRLNPSISASEFLSGMKPQTATSLEHFNELEKLKRQLQELGNYNGPPLVRGSQESNFINKVRSLATETKTSLENPEIWGKAGEMQKSLNQAAAKAIKPSELFTKRFMAIAGDGSRVVDPGKINTFIKQLGKHSADIKQDVLETYLKESAAVREEVGKIYEKLGVPNPIPPPSLSTTKTLLDKPTTGSKLADAAIHKGLANLAGGGVGGAIGAGLGHGVGLGAIGALAGEKVLGPGISSLIHPLIRPMLEGASSGIGLKAGAEYVGAVTKGESLLTKAAKNVFKQASKPIISAITASTERDRTKLDKAVVKAQTDPSFLASVGGDIGHYLPHHATAMAMTATNALNFLNSQRPDTGPKMPLDSKLPPDPGKKANYNRMLDLANAPLSILPKIAAGTITPMEIAGFRAMYPGLYNNTVSKLLNEMNSHLAKGEHIPYRTRVGLSLFAAQPLDSTMLPSAIQAAQPKGPQGPMAPQGGQQQKPPAASSVKGFSKLAKSAQTSDQAREQHAQKD